VPAKATSIADTISEPAARKLVEWLICAAITAAPDSKRYLAFIAANPNWPNSRCSAVAPRRCFGSRMSSRRRFLSFFNDSPPQSGTGPPCAGARAARARATPKARARSCARRGANDPLSSDIEKQVLERYSEFLSSADHKARMEKRLCRRGQRSRAAGRAPAGGRRGHDRAGAHRAQPQGRRCQEAARRRAGDARQDAGYILVQVQILRRADKIADAAKMILSAPRELAQVYDGEEWWVERGSCRASFSIWAMPVLPISRWRTPPSRPRRTPGSSAFSWQAGSRCAISMDPATAAAHFARIQNVSNHPTSLARSHYWLGRVAEASHRPPQARAEYQAAASFSAAYYGQLARARLGLEALALAPPPATPDKRAEAERLELVRALEILYALNERSLVLPLMAGLGDTLDDAGTLSALGELAEQRQDARGMLQLGKAALARGLPLDYYAFPTVACRAIRRSARVSTAQCCLRSFARRAPSIRPTGRPPRRWV